MEVLLLGGTGAMGSPLAKILSARGDSVTVTSRKKRYSEDIEFIEGNANDSSFLEKILKSKKWDAIVDFIVRTDVNLKMNLPLLLQNSKHYIFISSARVYAQSNDPIKEDTPRLLDVCDDKEYLKTNEYALAKARSENILIQNNLNNWTIIRPSITYNDNRLQLGVFEIHEWLYRALKGRSIVFSDDIASKITTNTYGWDVAQGIASIIGKPSALGKIFHITQPQGLKWSEILEIYVSVLQKRLGRKVNVVFTEKSTRFIYPHGKYQIIYCRYFNRRFDNSRINQYIDTSSFVKPMQGLAKCLEQFLDNPQFPYINWELEAIHDKITGEYASLDEITGLSNKLKYLLCRYNLRSIWIILTKLKEFIR